MTLEEIGKELVAGCREGREIENLHRLYAADAVSVEAMPMPGMGQSMTGTQAIQGKHAWWADNFTVHGVSVDGPFVHAPDRFAVIFDMDVESKADGKRSQSREVAVYHVSDGRIVREEFFYAL
jgi:ketosteroid isomerase-like protein